MQNLYLVHHGILGQKWGVRRFQNPDGTLTPSGKERMQTHTVKTQNGNLDIVSVKNGHLANSLGKMSSKIKIEQSKSSNMVIKDGKRKIGNLLLYEESPHSLNINWIDINTKSRGKGFAQAVLNDTLKYAKISGTSNIKSTWYIKGC